MRKFRVLSNPTRPDLIRGTRGNVPRRTCPSSLLFVSIGTLNLSKLSTNRTISHIRKRKYQKGERNL